MNHPKKLHQEIVLWYILPYIRKSIVDFLKENSIKQVEIANFLDITPSAVSQYIHSKRGNINGKFELKIKSKISELFGKDFNLKTLNSREILYELISFVKKESICCEIHHDIENFSNCCYSN
ncbi:MAG: transcriptional regulator [Candidatus Woesearchaeota archaeon]